MLFFLFVSLLATIMKHSHGITSLISFLILWGALVGASSIIAWALTDTSPTVVQTTDQQQLLTQTISVQWEGRVFVEPDTLVINLAASYLGKDTKTSQEEVNKTVADIVSTVKKFAIRDEKIQTMSLSLHPEYDYLDRGRSLRGYRAQQSLAIHIDGDNFTERGAELVDAVSVIANVEVNGISFELQDRVDAMDAAREKAFNHTKHKADQLADLAGSSVGGILTVADTVVNVYQPIMTRNFAMAESDFAGSSAWGSINAGQLEMVVQLQAVYEIN